MLLTASMMCANYASLAEDVKALDTAGIDMFHIDIMDGSFVPNFAMGRQDLALIRRTSSKPLDAHLMVCEPKNYLPIMVEEQVNIVYIHPETDNRVINSLQYLKEHGIQPGIAVSPQFSFSYVQELLPYAEFVLLMTVVPGFAGQTFLMHTRKKIDTFVRAKQDFKFQLMLDGAISPEIITYYSQNGVDGFILGTSSLFKKNKNYADTLKCLREGAKS